MIYTHQTVQATVASGRPTRLPEPCVLCSYRMVNPDAPMMWNLAVWLLAQEDIADEPAEGEEVFAAWRVGERLRRPLSTLALRK